MEISRRKLLGGAAAAVCVPLCSHTALAARSALVERQCAAAGDPRSEIPFYSVLSSNRHHDDTQLFRRLIVESVAKKRPFFVGNGFYRVDMTPLLGHMFDAAYGCWFVTLYSQFAPDGEHDGFCTLKAEGRYENGRHYGVLVQGTKIQV